MAPSKNKRRKKRFNVAGGKHSRSVKRAGTKETHAFEQATNKKSCGDTGTFNRQPYQLIRKATPGSISTRFVIRRIPILAERNLKIFKVGKSSLRFSIKKPVKQVLDGYRLVNLDSLKEHVVNITTHAVLCVPAQKLVQQGESPVTLCAETHKNGLASVLWAKCQGCDCKFPLNTSPKISNTQTADINVRAVWGSMCIGAGAAPLNELLGTMAAPNMRENMFSNIEHKIGSWWEGILQEDMMKAGAEEKRLAIERNDFHDGVPAITVICDGGWSKRTHKHTYNAPGGVGVIFGSETKKLLHLGVRNKYCCICSAAEKKKITPEAHTCFKNWSESSQAMEADVIVDGFLNAERVHGLRYMRIIADGDSSVYSQIQERVPVWGAHVQKLECANHACKCLRASLEKLVTEKPHYKGKGKLTKQTRVRLTVAVRCAIKMRSKENNARQLAKDIRNSIRHVLGLHDHCSNFCKKTKHNKVDEVVHEDDDELDCDPEMDDIDTIIATQTQFWQLGTDDDLEESRAAVDPASEDVRDIIRDVTVILNRLAAKSSRLIGNFTTNLAENWMGIRTKFDGGKMVNRCRRGAWHARCYGGALRKNLGPRWSPIAFQKATGQKPGTLFLAAFHKKALNVDRSRKSQQKQEVKDGRKRRKLRSQMDSSSKKAKREYGPGVKSDVPDVSTETLQQLCQKFLSSVVCKSKAEVQSIEERTRAQAQSLTWQRERKLRLTSSNFGKVMQRRPTNTSNKLVRALIYPSFTGNFYTIRGLSQESNTIIEYKNLKGTGTIVEKMGMVIDLDNPFLSASTDGRVVEEDGSTGLLEIKNVLQNKQTSLKDAARKINSFCLQCNENGDLKLRHNHAFFFQCQGQMNIMNFPWLDFVVRRTEPYEMHVERIYRDQDIWSMEMLPKLKTFYMKFMLPELALPRHGTHTGIRTPVSPWFTPLDPKSKTQTKKPIPQPRDPLPKLQKEPAKPSSPQPGTSCDSANPRLSRRRARKKFVGRRISHEWCVDTVTQETKWYRGIVLDVLKGQDGSPSAIYEVQYDEEDAPQEVDNLDSDFASGSLKFIDL